MSDSAPTDQPPSESTIYAWEIETDEGYNLIGMAIAGTSVVLPLVTTRLDVAWAGMSVAQAHADRQQKQARLVAYTFEALMAVLAPRQDETSDAVPG